MIRGGEVVVSEEHGMTFRFEGGLWWSYPTNIDGTCDFDDGTSVAVCDWETSSPGEVARVIAWLDAQGSGANVAT